MDEPTCDLPPLERLRHHLDVAERRVVVMHESPDIALEVIHTMDQIEGLLHELQGPEFDTRGEESRAEALRERLARAAGRVVRQVGSRGSAGQLTDSPTWRMLREAAAAQHRQWRRRFLGIGAGIAIVAILLVVVLPRVFPAPPHADIEAISRPARAGDIGSALATAQAEQARVPNDPAVALWIGALQQRRGDQAAAQQAWEAARRLYGDDSTFHMERGIVWLQLGDLAAAEADARALIAQPGSAAEGYYLLSQVEEERGQISAAIAALQQAAQLAEQEGNAQLTVLARTRLGYLMQQPLLPPTPAQS
jgi:tetratricopeptide (TPR) repeat protein